MVFQVDGVMVKVVGVIETSVLSLSVTTMLTLAVGMVARVTLMVAVVPNSLVIRAGDRGTCHSIITCNAVARVNGYCVAYIVIVQKIIDTCDSNSL